MDVAALQLASHGQQFFRYLSCCTRRYPDQKHFRRIVDTNQVPAPWQACRNSDQCLCRRTFTLDLPGTLAFDHPTATALTAFITSRLGDAQQQPAVVPPSAILAADRCALHRRQTLLMLLAESTFMPSSQGHVSLSACITPYKTRTGRPEFWFGSTALSTAPKLGDSVGHACHAATISRASTITCAACAP